MRNSIDDLENALATRRRLMELFGIPVKEGASLHGTRCSKRTQEITDLYNNVLRPNGEWHENMTNNYTENELLYIENKFNEVKYFQENTLEDTDPTIFDKLTTL